MVGHQVALHALLVEVRHLGGLYLEEGLESEGRLESTDRGGVEHTSADWGVVWAVLNEDDLIECAGSLGSLSLDSNLDVDGSISALLSVLNKLLHLLNELGVRSILLSDLLDDDGGVIFVNLEDDVAVLMLVVEKIVGVLAGWINFDSGSLYSKVFVIFFWFLCQFLFPFKIFHAC